MVKVRILVINNTPKKTYRIAQSQILGIDYIPKCPQPRAIAS
jgi:hypothetical protein